MLNIDQYPHHLLTCEEMNRADALAIAGGQTGWSLMERAGAAVADVARQMLESRGGTQVAVLCGPGNNGGDGFVAAHILRQIGYRVHIGLLGDPKRLSGDAATAAAAWSGPSGTAALIELDGADLVIDGLFGAGLSRDVDGRARAIIERVNNWRTSAGKPVLAIDIPSGIDGNSGAVRGCAIEADLCVTFFRLKPGHLLLPGRINCGELNIEQIGIPEAVLEEIRPKQVINLPNVWADCLPWPALDGHKYARGHALVLSGPVHQTGAARLSAMAALRAGAGLVTLASPDDALAGNAAHLTAVMLCSCNNGAQLTELLNDKRKNLAIAGPGLGVNKVTRELVLAALHHSNHPSVVLDADALTCFENDPEILFEAIGSAERPVALTPHDGEFSRLFKDLNGIPESISNDHDTLSQVRAPVSLQETNASRVGRARIAAKSSGAVVCLKGPDTIVAAPDGRISILAQSSPWLATAGTGDVLAGMIGGLLAQGMDAFPATSAAVWMHSQAALLKGPGLIAEDLPDLLPEVWQTLSEARQNVENL